MARTTKNIRKANQTHTGIAVIESRWWPNSNISVRGLFELVSDIYCGNPNAFHYEMANSEMAVKEAITRIADYKHCKYLSIAMHGNANKIELHNGEELSRSELRNALNGATKFKLTGLHLGSCSVGTHDLADWLFKKSVKLKWIAGYGERVSWLESYALDLLFFNELLKDRQSKETPSQQLLRVSQRVKSLAGGLSDQLGFGIFVPKQGTGGAKNIIKE